ncbi:polysaccharide deacetylase family protein [Gramella sp. MT6]|uniref:polysaccharide deacetylase family protein n=1 Tax=Gramella sp. MT6 TaxID=2705471 RepID=UPI001C5FB4FB|nr:polysaccharide deacetylase family protein [Gramella sp. MT6]QYA26046.1 polysaccharide deacetylase family protein [Gramella sp. MT6]
MLDRSGSLVISLDFELLWGVFDKLSFEENQLYFIKTRNAIPQILQIFEKFEIHATWATVGMLFNHNWEEWNSNIPSNIPNYQNRNLSAYNFGKSIQSKSTEFACFAPDLIKKIISTKNQELATHTYSHFYCREKGQDLKSFREDLKMSVSLAEKVGQDLHSLVFPRNQLNKGYLETCSDLGITSVRSNPNKWYWEDTQKDTLAQKIFRTGDAYIGKNNKSYLLSEISRIQNISIQSASRLLRPFSHNRAFNYLRLKRIANEMEYAAINGQIYHLWWHPHNFGNNPDSNLRDLTYLLQVYKKLRSKYNFSSMTMKELKNETCSYNKF